MTGIHFTVREPPRDGMVHVWGRGKDAVGNFTLSGTISTDMGGLKINKKYDYRGPSWDWLGQLSPFGIIASWGSSPAHGGWVWLWKTAWSHGSSTEDAPPNLPADATVSLAWLRGL